MAPTTSERVPWKPPAASAENLSPEQLAQDPAALIRFVEGRPERLDVANMSPDMALTLVGVLLQADRVFLADRLLHDGLARWPDDADLVRARARVLVSLGRPDAARRLLDEAIARWPGDPVLRYLLARAWLTTEPPSAETARAARAALQAVLEIDPAYVDPDQVTADELRQMIRHLDGQISGRKQ